jgi:hypothetical protein
MPGQPVHVDVRGQPRAAIPAPPRAGLSWCQGLAIEYDHVEHPHGTRSKPGMCRRWNACSGGSFADVATMIVGTAPARSRVPTMFNASVGPTTAPAGRSQVRYRPVFTVGVMFAAAKTPQE